MLVLNLPFKALMFLTLMRPSLVLFLVLWLKLVKDFLKVRCRLALLPFLISCLIWLDLVASLPLIKERILVIILLLHFLSLMLGSVLVLMLPLLVAPCLNCLEAVKKPPPVAFKVMCLLPITIWKHGGMLVLILHLRPLMFLPLIRPSLVLFRVFCLKLLRDSWRLLGRLQFRRF